MDLNLDGLIFIGFLVVTLIIGLETSRSTSTIKQYAVGDRNFSTATIVATIVATWMSGEFFYTHTSEVYTNGLYFIWAFILGDFLGLFFMGAIFIPRMGEFLGKISIAEAMGDLFGKRVRIITAITSFIGIAGLIAIQLKLAGLVFEYALGIPTIYGILIATTVVTLYSSLGGIKSVTFTDVIQFFTFGFAIPLSAYTLLITLDSLDIITHTVSTNPLFNYKEVFDFSNPLALKFLFFFMWCITPSFQPQYFQRIAIAKSILQSSRSFILAAFTCLFLAIMIDWIGVLVLAKDSTLSSSEVVKYIIFNSSYVGLKGLMLAGVMAMLMSTVDSCINSTSVIVVHDFFKPLKFTFIKNELFWARITSGIIGIAALILSLQKGSLLELLVITASFYSAIVTTPFLMAVLGFRSTEKSVIIGMIAGVTTVITWDYILKIDLANSVPIGMLANLIFLMGSHYLLKQPGGWVGIKDPSPLIAARLNRRRKFQKLYQSLKTFDLMTTFRKNCPKGDGLFSILGFFVMISTFSSAHTLDRGYQIQYEYLIDIFYPITLFSSAALISYPLWLSKWRKQHIEAILWNVVMFFVLICFSFLMVLISNFSGIQMMVFMVNLIILSSLITWKWALFNIIFGVFLTSFIYHKYVYIPISTNLFSSEFKVIYLLLMVISTLIIFLKPKQEYQELVDEKNGDLTDRLSFQEKQLQEALSLKAEFLRNITHEYHAPMTGVMSMADALNDGYDYLSDKQRRDAIKTILKSSARLESFDTNIAILSRISKGKLTITKEKINLSELILERIEKCQKLYDENKNDHEIILNIGYDIKCNLDKQYIIKVIDNLVINAITYCKKGDIEISLKKEDKKVIFCVQDEGVGIPQDELYNIFDEFQVSSKTKTPACGRGIGLTVAKKIIEVHGGSINAQSDGKKGAKFTVTLIA